MIAILDLPASILRPYLDFCIVVASEKKLLIEGSSTGSAAYAEGRVGWGDRLAAPG